MRKLVAVLLVLAVILVGADVGGRWYAQRQAERALAQHLPSDASPSVSIGGFSFLLQALPGRYSHVTIGSDDLGAGAVQHISARADLYDVDYPLRDAIDQTADSLTVGRAQLRVMIPGADLGAALGLPNLTVSPADGTAIRLRTSVSVAGETWPATVDVTAGVTGRTLRMSAAPVSVAGVHVPAAAVKELQRRLTTSVALPQLPFDVTSAAVSASGGNLVIVATATDLRADDLHLSAA